MYAALLKSLDNITVKKRENEGAAVEKERRADISHNTTNKDQSVDVDRGSSKRRLWLTEASLARLTEKILNNVENSLTSSSKSNHFKVDVTRLDASGLSKVEKALVYDWVVGKVSGRHCMCMLAAAESKNTSASANKQQRVISPDTIPSLLAVIASFPSSLIEKHSNVLFEKIFAKPPVVTVGEILKAIARRAKEKSCKLLRVEQINLAFKQMRLEKIRTTNKSGSNTSFVGDVTANDEASSDEKENNNANVLNDSHSDDVDASSVDMHLESSKESDLAEVKALKIMMELVFLFYSGNFHNKKSERKAKTSSNEMSKVDDGPVDASSRSDADNGNVEVVDASTDVNSASDSNNDSKCNVPNETTDETKTDVEESEMLQASENILKEVSIPQEKALEESKTMTHTELDKINRPIKFYISQLANLKQTLSHQLNVIEESGAYLDLGVTKDMSDSEIKRAYHKLSRKIHPDKPGGDTAKFQALQASYHEITQTRNKLNHSNDGQNSSSLEGVDKALALESEISTLVQTCKAAAEQVAALAQVTLQVLKMVEKIISKQEFPKCAPTLYTLLMGESDDGVGGPMTCLMNTVEPTETVAQCIQEISTKATEISGCSNHFALATALCSGFNKIVEETMSSGLEVLRAVTSMLGIENHASTCLEKMNSSRTLVIQDKEVHDIIVEMMLTVVRSCAVSLKSTADKVMSAVVLSSDLQSHISSIISEAKADAASKAQRDAEYAERRAEAEAMGDLEGFLEASKIRPGMGGNAGKDDAGNDHEEEEKEKGKKDDIEQINGIDELRAKVQGLQIQIRMQNVSILQSLTCEVCSMQKKMHSEVCRIQSLPAFSIHDKELSQTQNSNRIQILALLADLIDHSLVIVRNRCNNGSIVDVNSWNENLENAFDWMKYLETRLALWPDLRTRTLYFAALIDINEVKNIISSELVDRLTECLQCPSMKICQSADTSCGVNIDTNRHSAALIKDEWLFQIQKLCNCVVNGVHTAMETLQEEEKDHSVQDDKNEVEIDECDMSVEEFEDIDCDDNDHTEDKKNPDEDNTNEAIHESNDDASEDTDFEEDGINYDDDRDDDTEVESIPPSPEAKSLDEAVKRVSHILLGGEGSSTADNHTYDKGYKKWEKFDVNAALAELDSASDSSD